jgi:general stress protein 26
LANQQHAVHTGREAAMTEEADEAQIWKIAARQRVAMLTTFEDGKLVSRPMSSLVRPEEGCIYFVTRMDTSVGDIVQSVPVNLGYSDIHKNTYLSIAGAATTSQDRAKLEQLWSMFTEAWLPEGPDGADVALVTVVSEEAKLWDATSSALVYAAKVLKANITQTPPDGGTVKQVSLGTTS